MHRALAAVVIAMFFLAVPWAADAQLFPTSPFPSPEPVATDAAAPQASAASLSDFTGGWWHHGFSLSVGEDGTAEASWRTYQNCGNGVTSGCDRFEGNLIVNGGHAVILFESAEVPAAPRDWAPVQLTSKPAVFAGVQLPIAHGRVLTSTQPSRLRVGSIDLVMLPYDTGSLVQDGDGVIVCRPDDLANVVRVDEMTPEQRERWAHRACGA
jgi:hypothetical protein